MSEPYRRNWYCLVCQNEKGSFLKNLGSRFWEMNMWTEFLPKSVLSLCQPCARKIPPQNSQSVGLCMDWAIGTDCTPKVCRDVPISYFPAGERSSSFMDVFGTVIRSVGTPRCQSRASTFGWPNSKGTWLATAAFVAS